MNMQQNKFGNWIKNSITARMLMIGILIIVLLIPLSFIVSLIRERASRQESVVNEINEKFQTMFPKSLYGFSKLSSEDLIHDKYIILSRGKKTDFILKVI
mgnify:CR=1 FL=1